MPAEYGNSLARERYKIFKKLQSAVRQKIRRGELGAIGEDDARRLASYDPLIEIAVMANDRETPKNMRLLCHMEIAKYVHAPLKATELALTDASGGQVVVQIQSFADRAPKPAMLPEPILHTSTKPGDQPREVSAELLDEVYTGVDDDDARRIAARGPGGADA